MTVDPQTPKFVDISALIEQQERGYARLKFSPTLEGDFRDWFFDQNRMRVFYTLVIGMLLFIAYGFKELAMAPEPIGRISLLLRVCVASPILLFAAVQSYLGIHRVLTEISVLLGGVAALSVVAAIVVLSRRVEYVVPYEGLALIAMFIFYVSGLRLSLAFWATFVCYAGYWMTVSQTDIPADVYFQQVFFLVMSLAVGVLGAYSLEFQARAHYLQREIALFRADTDELTGLPNRRAVLRQMRLALRHGQREEAPIAVFMIDVDFFKSYNDHRGHVQGDVCLRAVAQALEVALKRPFDVVGRTGGEEFVAMAYGSSTEFVRELGQRFVDSVAAMKISHPTSPHGVVTVSVGALPLDPASEEPLELLLSRADAAMYSAKESGRNRCVLAQR